MNQYGFVDIVLLSGFANYFNRKIFYYNTLQDYLDHSEDSEEKNDINFNPADGVNAVLDVNVDDDIYQYLLVVDHETGDILSRWWIIEADRNLSGQYRLTLRRDVVAESIYNEDFRFKAPIYVEKGQLANSDPMIVNSEGMNFNQIKKSETLLTDPSEWGYIVGYMANDANVASRTLNIGTATPSDIKTLSDIASDTGIDLYILTNMISASTPINFCTSKPDIVFGLKVPLAYERVELVIPNDLIIPAGLRIWSIEGALAWSHAVGYEAGSFNTPLNKLQAYISNNGAAALKNALTDVLDNDVPDEKFFNQDNLTKLLAYEGQIISYAGQYYIINFTQSQIVDHNEVVINKGENSYFNGMIAAAEFGSEYDDWELYLNFKTAGITAELTPYNIGSCKYSIPSSHSKLADAPFSMFVIPYTNKLAFRANGNVPFAGNNLINKEQALMIASDIATQLADKLYDIQLLPYIPDYSNWIIRWNNAGYPDYKYWVKIDDKTINVDYAEINTTGTPADTIGVILFPQRSNSSFTIQKEFYSKDDPKIESQCNFYRLCSPNYNGVFEFNLAKNGGSVILFDVDITYKPINPFIRITPQFKGLYGQSFKDGRGLILGGDFSLPVIKDAWITYQQNNKNFATMFARDIQNLDVSQKQERFKENISLGAGIVGGGATGAVAGGKLGGAYGAIAGAAVGTGLGAVGAAIDTRLGQERRAEAKDYLIDRFNMNLGNIKALPDSLAKNSAFTIINKIFPFVEYYTCTDEEKEALKRKIAYDGMTVGRIDYVSAFAGGNNQQQYFKGQLIRAEGINEDNHFVNALYEEIAKGVYI